jgi:hypothetical protein
MKPPFNENLDLVKYVLIPQQFINRGFTVNSFQLGGVCVLHRQGLWSQKREDFYLKFEPGVMSKTHKSYFPISHTHTMFFKLCVVMLYSKSSTYTCNSFQMFPCEPKTV